MVYSNNYSGNNEFFKLNGKDINPYKEFHHASNPKILPLSRIGLIFGKGYGSSSMVFRFVLQKIDGDIAEFVIFDRLVDQNEHHQITHYLSNKWKE